MPIGSHPQYGTPNYSLCVVIYSKLARAPGEHKMHIRNRIDRIKETGSKTGENLQGRFKLKWVHHLIVSVFCSIEYVEQSKPPPPHPNPHPHPQLHLKPLPTFDIL